MSTGTATSGPAAPDPVRREDKDPAADYLAPRTDLEADLAGTWSRRLNVAPVGVDDDFFELGGHSILATEILVEVERVYGAAIPARTLFLAPTVAQLAEAIENAQATTRQESAR